MPAHKGNQYAKGNKGGGRPSEALALKKLLKLEEIYLTPWNRKEIIAKIKNSELPATIQDMVIAKLLTGKDAFLLWLLGQLYPKELKLSMRGDVNINFQKVNEKIKSYVPPKRRRQET